jgi:hypothetical protein
VATGERTQVRIEQIDVWSLAKVLACTQAVLCVIAIAAHAMLVDYLTDGQSNTLILAIFWAGFGWVGGMLAGVIYGHLYNATAAFSSLPVRLKPVEDVAFVEEQVPESDREGLASRAKTVAIVIVAVAAAIWVGLLFPMETTYQAAKKHYEQGVEGSRDHCYRALQLATSRPYLSLLYPTKRSRMHQWAQKCRLELAYDLLQSEEAIAAGMMAREYLENGGSEKGRKYAQGLLKRCSGLGVDDQEIAAARNLRYVVHDTSVEKVGEGRNFDDFEVGGKVTVHNGNDHGLALVLVCEIPDHGAEERFAMQLEAGKTKTLEFSYDTFSSYAVTLTPDRVFVYPSGFTEGGG